MPNCTVARLLLGIDAPAASPPVTQLTETGAGQVVAVADTGLDDTHPDFAGRIAGLIARGRPGDATDPHGHGTHVAASVLGSGLASGGQHRGVAPGAQLVAERATVEPAGDHIAAVLTNSALCAGTPQAASATLVSSATTL